MAAADSVSAACLAAAFSLDFILESAFAFVPAAMCALCNWARAAPFSGQTDCRSLWRIMSLATEPRSSNRDSVTPYHTIPY